MKDTSLLYNECTALLTCRAVSRQSLRKLLPVRCAAASMAKACRSLRRGAFRAHGSNVQHERPFWQGTSGRQPSPTLHCRDVWGRRFGPNSLAEAEAAPRPLARRYIVYDTKQVSAKYLVQVTFNFH